MCGRYALHSLIQDLQQHFGLFDSVDFKPRYNISPSLFLPVVRPQDGGVELALCQWGFIPGWLKSMPKNKSINARAESLADKPFFRSAFRLRRCLVPANGFYEWKRTGTQKQPYYIRLSDAELFSFAGIWDRWEGGGEPVETFAIITTDANEAMKPIHDRMPVILDPAQYERWLRSGGSDLLVPFAGPMQAFPVSRRVNSPANDGAELIRRGAA